MANEDKFVHRKEALEAFKSRGKPGILELQVTCPLTGWHFFDE
jgi:hypothetical protein